MSTKTVALSKQIISFSQMTFLTDNMLNIRGEVYQNKSALN